MPAECIALFSIIYLMPVLLLSSFSLFHFDCLHAGRIVPARFQGLATPTEEAILFGVALPRACYITNMPGSFRQISRVSSTRRHSTSLHDTED